MFNVGDYITYGYCAGLRISKIEGDRVRLSDHTGKQVITYTQILVNCCRKLNLHERIRTLDNGIDLMARACKEELIKSRSSESKATLTDLRLVVLGGLTGDFEPVYKTNLYNKYGGEYCQSLEIINRIRLTEKNKYN